MMYKAECVVCHQPLTYRFVLCAACEKIYGKKRKGWPDWLLFLVREAEKDRKRYERRQQYEAEIDDIYFDSCVRLAQEGMRGVWAGAGCDE